MATHKRLASRPLHHWLPDPRRLGVLVIPREHARDEDRCLFRRYLAVEEYTAPDVTTTILDAARDSGVQRIASATEVDVGRIAYVRSVLGLDGLLPESARLFTDKAVMRRHALHLGLPSPDFVELTAGGAEIGCDNAWGLGWPVVAKPRLGTGGRGIEILRTGLEARQWLKTAEPKDDEWIVEQYVDGDLFHIDGLMQSGDILHAWPSRYNTDALTALKNSRPHTSYLLDESDPLTNCLQRFAERVVEGFPHLEERAAFHLEAFVGESGPVLCEVACRPAGGGVDLTQETAFGISLASQHLRGQLGLASPDPLPSRPRIYAGWALLPARSEHLHAYSPIPTGLSLVKAALPKTGPLQVANDVADAVGLVVVSAPSANEVRGQLAQVEEWWEMSAQWG